MPVPVLIAESQFLDGLKARPEYLDALAFLDTDTPRALEAVLRHKPEVVAIERTFAGKSRGVALIKRIKADPSLTGCEVRIVGIDGSVSRVATRRRTSKTTASPAPAPKEPATMVQAPSAVLDQHGTRRAPRVRIVEGIEVTVDGKPAMLVDLSLVGAQVLSGSLLKPNQRVRVLIPENERAVRFNATVAWSTFELPKGEARYRAGITFVDADPAVIGRFCETNRHEAMKA